MSEGRKYFFEETKHRNPEESNIQIFEGNRKLKTHNSCSNKVMILNG
jgi:hypothetical protein